MATPKELAYARNQFEISKMYALYWQAMATTGAAKKRKIQCGREVAPEEKAAGECIGWTDLTPEELVEDALNTMHTHIHRMIEMNDWISENTKE